MFKEWVPWDFELALPAALYWNDTWTFPQGKAAVGGTSLWWEEETTGVFCLAGVEELHFSPLHFTFWGGSVTIRDIMHGPGETQSRPAPALLLQHSW